MATGYRHQDAFDAARLSSDRRQRADVILRRRHDAINADRQASDDDRQRVLQRHEAFQEARGGHTVGPRGRGRARFRSVNVMSTSNSEREPFENFRHINVNSRREDFYDPRLLSNYRCPSSGRRERSESAETRPASCAAFFSSRLPPPPPEYDRFARFTDDYAFERSKKKKKCQRTDKLTSDDEHFSIPDHVYSGDCSVSVTSSSYSSAPHPKPSRAVPDPPAGSPSNKLTDGSIASRLIAMQQTSAAVAGASHADRADNAADVGATHGEHVRLNTVLNNDRTDTTSVSSMYSENISATSREDASSRGRRGNRSFLTFYGDDFATFKKVFQVTAQANHWDDAEKLRRLLNALRGPAQKVITLLADEVITFDKLFNVLECHYQITKSYVDVMTELEAMLLKPGQRVHEFAIDVTRVLDQAEMGDAVRKQLACYYFVNGLRSNRDMQLFINRKDQIKNNINVALDYAVKWERTRPSSTPEQQGVTQLHNVTSTSQKPGIQTEEIDNIINDPDTTFEHLEVEHQRLRTRLEDVQVMMNATQATQPPLAHDHVDTTHQKEGRVRRWRTTKRHRRRGRFRQEEHHDHPPMDAIKEDSKVRIIDIRKQDYIWVDYAAGDVKALTLIDTGAQVSVLPKQLYDAIPEEMKKPLRETDVELRLADGTDVLCYGIMNVAFDFQDMSFAYDMHIIDDVMQPILGYDFLHEVGDAEVLPAQETVKIRGNKLKLTDRSGVRISHKVSMAKTVTLGEGEQCVVHAFVQGKDSIEGLTTMLEPASSLFRKTGAIVCKTTVTPRKNIIPVRIMNPHEVPISIFKGTVLGILREVDQLRTWTDESGEDESEQQTSTTPDVHQQHIADIQQMSQLPTDGDGSIDYSKVPEHLQELFDRTKNALDFIQQNTLRRVLNDYEDVFARTKLDIGKAVGVKHHVDTGTDEPVHQRPRRLAKAHAAVMQKNVKELADAGVIRPSESEWASNVVMARKKDGTWRMCVDYRDLNIKTRNKGTYMLPRIDDTLDSLSRAKYFCSLDVIQGYHHIELTEESKAKTAFHAPRCNPSHWEYNFMPFGLVGAPRTFQKMMDRIILGLEYKIALAYLDDIIVFGATIEECIHNLELVFQRVRKAGLKLKPSKCSLFQRETSYLGHVISAEGVKTDPKKVETVKNFLPPRNLKDVQTFIGMTQYYAKFIPNFMGIASPIVKLMSKKVKFHWGAEQQEAFETLKSKLVSAPILAYPIDDAPFILDTDASDYAMGAVLSQMQEDEKGVLVERPIAYHSKRFSDTEKHYCARRRELLAIVFHVKYFNPYLRGTEFVIRTDHASLRYIKTVKELPSQFHRWVMMMEEYTYEVEVRKGILHANADGMSRMPCEGKVCICTGVAELESTVGMQDSGEAEAVINMLRFKPVYTVEEMQASQSNDPDIKPLYTAKLGDGIRPTWNKVSGESPAAKAYMGEWRRIEVHDKLLYRRWENDDGDKTHLQLLVPLKYQRELCRQFHDKSSMAHMGRRRCYAAIQMKYFWYKMADDIRWWIRTCEVCQRRKPPSKTPRAPMTIYVTGFPGERLSWDVVGPMHETKSGNKYLLCIADHFSRWAKAFPMKDQKAKTIADIFLNRWVDDYGAPMQIHNDQGTNFESTLMKELMKLLDVEKTRTVAFKPSSDGLIERYNRTIVDMTAKLSRECPHTWDEVVGKAVAAYNASKHSRTGYTPNKLWTNRECFHAADLMMPTRQEMLPVSTDEYVRRTEEQMRVAYRLARETIGRNVKIQKKYYDRKSHLVKYKEGDAVWLKDFSSKIRGENKLSDKWLGPYYILDVMSDTNFRIIKDPGSKGKVINHDRIKPAASREPVDVKWVLEKSKTYKESIDAPRAITKEKEGKTNIKKSADGGTDGPVTPRNDVVKAVTPSLATGNDVGVTRPEDAAAMRPVPKRGRGRPRKVQAESGGPPQARGRGQRKSPEQQHPGLSAKEDAAPEQAPRRRRGRPRKQQAV